MQRHCELNGNPTIHHHWPFSQSRCSLTRYSSTAIKQPSSSACTPHSHVSFCFSRTFFIPSIFMRASLLDVAAAELWCWKNPKKQIPLEWSFGATKEIQRISQWNTSSNSTHHSCATILASCIISSSKRASSQCIFLSFKIASRGWRSYEVVFQIKPYWTVAQKYPENTIFILQMPISYSDVNKCCPRSNCTYCN